MIIVGYARVSTEAQDFSGQMAALKRRQALRWVFHEKVSGARSDRVGKFSEHDLSVLKGKDDLVAQIVAKYGLEKAQAQCDVDAVLMGRQI